MGKKADQVKNELALVQNKYSDALSEQDRLAQENYALREQLARFEESIDEPAQLRLVTDVRAPTAREAIAKALGIELPPGRALDDHDILEAVQRLRGPTSDGEEGALTKRNESLAEAVAANKAQRQELDDRLTQSKNIVNRIAATLQVDRWGTDGEEIVEKAQRLSTFHYWLKKRLHVYEQGLARNTDDSAFLALVTEVRTIMAALVGEAQLAKLVQSKLVKVSKTILDLAENKPPENVGIRFEHNDFHKINHALETVAAELVHAGVGTVGEFATGPYRVEELASVFLQQQSSGVATDLVDFMNAVVLPSLAKLRGPAKGA